MPSPGAFREVWSARDDAKSPHYSLNHRIAWVGRDVQDPLLPAPLAWAGMMCCAHSNVLVHQPVVTLCPALGNSAVPTSAGCWWHCVSSQPVIPFRAQTGPNPLEPGLGSSPHLVIFGVCISAPQELFPVCELCCWLRLLTHR